MRSAGPLTRRDRDAIAAMRAALRTAAERVEPTLRAMQAAGAVLTPVLVQLARGVALVEAYDAQPRHRELPSRDDTIEWLDRHCGQVVEIIDDPPGRPGWDPDRQARAIQWWAEQRRGVVDAQIRLSQEYPGVWPPDLDRPGAGGRYSHTGGWIENWRASGG